MCMPEPCYEAEGDMDFDQERDRLIDDRHVVLFAGGNAVVVTAGTEPGVSCSSRESPSARPSLGVVPSG